VEEEEDMAAEEEDTVEEGEVTAEEEETAVRLNAICWLSFDQSD